MATLAANASATQERLKVSAIPAGDYFQIDDEIVRVIDKRTTQLTILVERAYAGTTAATHNSGAELTPLYVPSTGGGGGSGLSVIGPFTIDHQTDGLLDGEPLHLADLDVGTIVIKAWLEVETAFADATGVTIELYAGGATWDSPDYRAAPIGSYNALEVGSVVNDADLGIESVPTADFVTQVARIKTAGAFNAYFSATGTPTAGSVRIYALVAEA